jgi:hypothetical protein
MGIVGMMVLSGLILHQGVPEKFRVMFGVVLTLMGGYRFVLTRTRRMEMERQDREDDQHA